jgi:hypothetical protein
VRIPVVIGSAPARRPARPGRGIAPGRGVGERADRLDDRLQRGTRAGTVEGAVLERGIQGDAHRGEVLGRGPTAAPDDPRAGVDREPHVARHELRRPGVVDLRAAELRDAAVALGDERGLGVVLRHREQRHEDVGRTDAAVRTGRHGRDRQTVEHGGEVAGQQAHHRPARGVERAGRDVGDADLDRRVRRGAHLLGRRHRLDPRDVGTPGRERGDLLAERRACVGLGERTERLEERAGGPDRPGHDDGPVGGLGHLARELGRPPRELGDARLGAVQGEAVPVAPERVGEDDVGARLDEAAVQVLHAVGVVGVPQLGGLAGGQPHAEVVGARRTVGEQHALGGEELGETGAHARTVAPGPFDGALRSVASEEELP